MTKIQEIDPDKAYIISAPNLTQRELHQLMTKLQNIKPGDFCVVNAEIVFKEELKQGAPFP